MTCPLHTSRAKSDKDTVFWIAEILHIADVTTVWICPHVNDRLCMVAIMAPVYLQTINLHRHFYSATLVSTLPSSSPAASKFHAMEQKKRWREIASDGKLATMRVQFGTVNNLSCTKRYVEYIDVEKSQIVTLRPCVVQSIFFPRLVTLQLKEKSV